MPESTGDRVGHYHTWDIEYTGRTREFLVGETIKGGTSGVEAIVINDKEDNDTANAGVLSTILKSGYENKSMVAGEAITISASTIATAGSAYCIYIGKQTLSGGNNPFYLQSIDNEGQAYIRFAEGAQQMDAFGITRTTTPNQIGEYFHIYDDQSTEWQNETSGGGNILHLGVQSAMRLQCGTASGDLARRTTHKYHYYAAGQSQLTMMTIVIGDTGKANVRRRWGYFDDNDGIYFELDGTTLYVVLRSSVSGSVVNTRVAKSSWNGDVLDGTGLSGMTLDVSLMNIYWIDLQWLGAGRIRTGVFDEDGHRTITHTMQNANTNTEAYMRLPSLPLRYEQENTAGAGSTSEMKFGCGSVFTEGPTGREHEKYHYMESYDFRNVNISTTVEIPLISIRPALVIGSSVVNRIGSVPENISLNVQDNPVFIRIRKNADLVSASFDRAAGVVSVDVSAVSISAGSGQVLTTYIFGVGAENIDIDEHFNYLRRYLRLNADGVTQNVYTITAEPVSGSATVDGSFTWFSHYGTD